MKEKDFQVKFSKENKIFGAFELKICKTNRLSLISVKDHQIEALSKIQTNEGLFHKITDVPVSRMKFSRFTHKKPFDCFFLREVAAYVVIGWYHPRKYWNVYYIPINVWVRDILNPHNFGAKSLQEEDAIFFSKVKTQWKVGNK